MRRSRRTTLAIYALVGVSVVLFMFPLVWLFLTSIKPAPDTFAYPPVIVFTPTVESYTQVFAQSDFPKYLMNSVIVGILSTVTALTLGLPAAYALARLRVRGRGVWRAVALIPQMLPPIVVVIPVYMIFRSVGLLDNVLALAFTYLAFTVPISIWILTNFVQDLPPELDEAALVDGASRLQTLRQVILPLVRPGLAATAVICLLYTWNEFLYALILTGKEAKTAPVAIVGFMTNKEIYWGKIAAAGTVVLVPVLAFGIVAHRHLARGLVSGSGK
jgi:multiple sugar transport system permease protein